MSVKVKTAIPASFKVAINDAGWLEDEVLAAGHLRQGKAVGGFMKTYAQLQVLLPRKSKKLPRHFALAVTANEVVAFKVTEVGGQESAGAYEKLKILDDVKFRYPRASVSMSDLPKGEKSEGGTITIDGESFPVMRPNLYGDPNTDELIAVLAGPASAH